MVRAALIFLLVAVVFSLGLAMHLLLWAAIVLMAFWLITFIVRPRARRSSWQHR
ncbi:MAG: hydrophobic protein [Candidatus Dormibacteria bacterium]|jgi:hypothetical protein